MNRKRSAEIVYLKPEYARYAKRSTAMTTPLSHKIGLVLHVDDTLGDKVRNNIEASLQAEQGVSSAHFTERRPHLMTVEYDPDVTTSAHILNKVHSQNVHAQLIGPI